jgi:uncharacterized membrane protein
MTAGNMVEGNGFSARTASRWLLSLFYGAAGILHLTATDKFMLIVPDWVPIPRLVVEATGICEIAGALALFSPRLRKLAGVLLALYAVCVFPANVKHAFDAISVPGLPSSWWYHGPRLALQPVLVWWALHASGVIDWPWSKRGRP